MTATSSPGFFVGREHELARLLTALHAARRGRGQVVTVSGEAGIGKTRLTEELGDRASRDGAVVLWARAPEGSGAPAYWPWTQIIRGYRQEVDPGEFAAALGSRAADVAHLVPELAQPPPFAPRDPDAARFRLFDAVSQLLVVAANRRPLVLVLDDLHWADTPSLRLLAFLAGHVDAAAILVVAIYRDVELHTAHPLAGLLTDLARQRRGAGVALTGLGPADTASYAEHVAGQPLPDGLVEAVHDKTDGNPFYITELMRLLAAERRLATPDQVGRWELEMPLGVREVILRRLDRLSPACHRLLRAAAFVGRDFTIGTLASVTDLRGDRVLGMLAEAERLRVVRSSSLAPGRFRFAHALIREALYDSLTASLRVEQHRRIGEALEEHYGADRDSHLAELAHHYAQAAVGGTIGKAVDYAVRAAERATRSLAHEEAVRLYRVALETLDSAGHGSEGQRCELLVALGEARRRAGDVDGARGTLRSGGELAARLGSAELLARAALAFGGPWVTMGVVDHATTGLLQRALDALGDSSSGLRAQVLARLGMELYFSPARERGQELCRQAVEMAHSAGDDGALGYALSARHWTLWGPDHLEDRLQLATELVELASRLDDTELAVQGHHWRGNDLLEMGDVAAAETAVDAHARLAAELGHPVGLWQAALRQVLLALLAGRFEVAERLAGEARRRGQLADPRSAAGSQLIQLFVLRREQGRLGELQDDLEETAAANPAAPIWRAVLALAYVDLGRELEARAELDRLAADGFRSLPRDYAWIGAMVCLADSCAALGEASRAETLLGLLEPYAARSAFLGRASASLGSVARPLGLLAATAGRPAEAEAHFERALEANARIGAWPWLARTQHAYAALLATGAGAQGSARAAGLLDQASAGATRLGMPGLAEPMRALGAVLAAKAPAALTQREIEVIRLIAAGRSNRQIAETLVISVNTVLRHVTHILSKTGATNRAEAAVFAAHHGLL